MNIDQEKPKNRKPKWDLSPQSENSQICSVSFPSIIRFTLYRLLSYRLIGLLLIWCPNPNFFFFFLWEIPFSFDFWYGQYSMFPLLPWLLFAHFVTTGLKCSVSYWHMNIDKFVLFDLWQIYSEYLAFYMFCLCFTSLQKTRTEYNLHPTEKLQKELNGIQTRIRVLEQQLQKAYREGAYPKVHCVFVFLCTTDAVHVRM